MCNLTARAGLLLCHLKDCPLLQACTVRADTICFYLQTEKAYQKQLGVNIG